MWKDAAKATGVAGCVARPCWLITTSTLCVPNGIGCDRHVSVVADAVCTTHWTPPMRTTFSRALVLKPVPVIVRVSMPAAEPALGVTLAMVAVSDVEKAYCVALAVVADVVVSTKATETSVRLLSSATWPVVQTMAVAVADETAQAAPAMRTRILVASVEKPEPETVTTEPPALGPKAGETPRTRRRTSKLALPVPVPRLSVRTVTACVPEGAPPSRMHVAVVEVLA
mmetsp:Transcript_21376/g.66306  ORF Transcript_21376/g.66306 Transcript_21376/m.66306 type:complete len:227 (+) Transcript_21376:1651-2331(+)